MTIGVQACGDRVPDIWALANGVPKALDELAELAALASQDTATPS